MYREYSITQQPGWKDDLGQHRGSKNRNLAAAVGASPPPSEPPTPQIILKFSNSSISPGLQNDGSPLTMSDIDRFKNVQTPFDLRPTTTHNTGRRPLKVGGRLAVFGRGATGGAAGALMGTSVDSLGIPRTTTKTVNRSWPYFSRICLRTYSRLWGGALIGTTLVLKS